MDEPFNTFFQLHKYAEISDICDLALNNCPDGIIAERRLPGIRLQLFDAQRKAFIFFVDLEDYRLDCIAF